VSVQFEPPPGGHSTASGRAAGRQDPPRGVQTRPGKPRGRESGVKKAVWEPGRTRLALLDRVEGCWAVLALRGPPYPAVGTVARLVGLPGHGKCVVRSVDEGTGEVTVLALPGGLKRSGNETDERKL